jgi:hypothetical protein
MPKTGTCPGIGPGVVDRPRTGGWPGVPGQGGGSVVGREAGGVAVERGAEAGLGGQAGERPGAGADGWYGGRPLVMGLFAFTIAVIALHTLFDRVMTTDTGLVGLGDALARPFLRPFAALMGPTAGWHTSAVAVAIYTIATLLILRALRRAEHLALEDVTSAEER